MISNNTKRVGVLLGVLVALVVVGALYFAFEISRDVNFDWENPNNIEAAEARRKLKKYETALVKHQDGWVRFSQLEINSYLMSATTNELAEGAGYQLRRVGVELTTTNATFYSWGETHFLKLPLSFVLQRTFRIRQGGTNVWDLPIDELKIGDLEIPKRFWPRLKPAIHALDRPLVDYLGWATNVQALLITKNEISQRPELRLYTYSPIPPADIH